MGDFLAFRKMITTIIIQVLFWVGLVAILALGVWTIIEAHQTGWGYDRWDVVQVVYGVLTILLGPIVWRVYCEMLIIFFRMNETLTDIKNITETRIES